MLYKKFKILNGKNEFTNGKYQPSNKKTPTFFDIVI